MAKKIYHPLKKSDWSKIQRNSPKIGANRRVIETVRIGIAYDKNGGSQQDLFEDIYEDLLPKILAVHKPLRIIVNITCTPRIVVFDGSDIIPHNPAMVDYIDQIKRVLPSIDEDIYYRAYVKSWESTALKKPMDYSVKAVVQEVNEKTNGNFPAELVIALMRKSEADIFLPVEDNDDIRQGVAGLDDGELKVVAGDIVACSIHNGIFNSAQLGEILKDTSYENEDVVNAVVQEVFKRYILS